MAMAGGGGFGMIGGMMQGMMGAQMQMQGGRMQAQGYRQAAQNVMQAATYNLQIIDMNKNRDLRYLGDTMRTTLSTQKTQAAHSNLAVGSKSFRMLYNETMYKVLYKASQVRKDAELQRQKVWFEASAQAQALENQARAAEYSGRMGAMQSMMGAFNSIARVGFGQ